MIVLEIIAATLGFVAMLSASALGVHVLLEDSEVLGHLKNKLKAPDEAELVKRNALKLEAKVEAEEKKRRQMEYWGWRLDNAHEKWQRLEEGEEPDRGGDNRFADGAHYEFKHPDDKIGTEMRQARETSQEFGETAEELRERMERAIQERFQEYKAEAEKRERMERPERQRRRIPLEVVHRYHSTPSHQRPRKYEAEAEGRERNRRIPLEMVHRYYNTPPHRRPPGGMSELARINDLVRRTINNEFGMGQERRRRLGPDYEPVQAEVNRMLKKATQKTNGRT